MQPDNKTDGIPRFNITLHLAQTLDGQIATRQGQAKWISARDSYDSVQELRSKHDCVLIGINTVLKDNPQLRVKVREARNPLRVVLDSSLRMPLNCALLAPENAERTLILCTNKAPMYKIDMIQQLGAAVSTLPMDSSGRVSVPSSLQHLYERDIHSILIEGGQTVATSFLKLKLVDTISICIAPMIIGRGLNTVGDLGINDLRQAIQIENWKIQTLGSNILIQGKLVYSTK